MNKVTALKKILLAGVLLSLLGAYHEWVYMAPGPHLEIEGLLKKPNYRDVGQSINECLLEASETFGISQPILNTGLIHRANKWFSGWSCDKVGNPDHIYTLNYEPEKDHSYYCRRSDGNKVHGTIFSKEKEISDIEFLASWRDSVLEKVVCSTVKAIAENIVAGKSSLYHCEAGRDRTGAMSALFAAAALEHALPLSLASRNEQIERAVECDYRKSKSIGEDKYGRMSNFIKELRNLGYGQNGYEVSSFLIEHCELDADLINKSLKKMVAR